MGNYQEYLKQVPSPLRELDPDQPRRLHTFGNPFKLDKKVTLQCSMIYNLFVVAVASLAKVIFWVEYLTKVSID